MKETITVSDHKGSATVEANVVRTFVWEGEDGTYPQSEGQASELAFEQHGIQSWYNYEVQTVRSGGRYLFLVTVWF